VKIEIKRKQLPKIILTLILITAFAFAGFVAGVSMSYPVGFKEGHKSGFAEAVTAINQLEDKTGLTFEWSDKGNGQYELRAFYKGACIATVYPEVHCAVSQYRPYENLDFYQKAEADLTPLSDAKWMYWYDINENGEADFPTEYKFLIQYSYHDGTLTTIGKNWIEDQLGDSPATDPAKWISVSNTTQTPNATWTTNYEEITTDGLARAAGTYADDGDGDWNQTKTFSVSGTNSTVCYGLHWAASGDNNLLCAENQGAGNRKNVNSGDTLAVTWQASVS